MSLAAWAPPATATAFTLAETLLGLVHTSAVSLGIVLPTREFISLSPVVADCAMVAVLIEGIYPNPPLGDQLMQCFQFSWVARFGIVIIRETCAIPQGRSTRPTPESITEAARIASDDMEVMRGVVELVPEAGALEINAKPPAGGMQSVELLINLRADGTL